MRTILALMLVCVCAFGQTSDGPTYVKSQGVPAEKWTTMLAYDGSDNLEYVGIARSDQKKDQVFSINASTLTNCIDSTNTLTCTTPSAHGLNVSNLVCFTGAADADLNVCLYIQTVGSTTTFTATTASVTDTTYSAAGFQFTTRAPRTTDPIWTITKLSYTGTNLIRKQQSPAGAIWDNRATTTGSTKVSYQ